MSDFIQDHVHRSCLQTDENYDKDDLITFQLESNKINLYYSQFVKYSKHIRDEYLFQNVIDSFPQEIQKFQTQFHLSTEIILFFFQLLQDNYNFDNKRINLTHEQC